MTSKTLLEFSPGAAVVVQDFRPSLNHEDRSHLLAWGIAPGTELRVLAHQPVTRLLIEHAELAIESQVAQSILVRPLDTDNLPSGLESSSDSRFT
jgi:Fe2+ transport system protein FeoA